MQSPERAPIPGSPADPVAAPGGRAAGGPRPLWWAAFFLSGAAGLAYEVALGRGLLRVLGSTAATAAVVLAAFVGGLGLGARWGGERVARGAHPLRLYGALEVAAAGAALLALPLCAGLGPAALAVGAAVPWLGYAARILLAGLVVLPVAFLLGATLPALVGHFVGVGERAARPTAWLYGLNTLGAVLGAVGAGVLGVRALGVDGMLGLAAAVGGGVGLLALALARGGPARPAAEAAPPAAAAWLARHAAFACGFLGLAIELVAFRLLVFFLEGFTATFAAMLGVFILGLGAGSLLLGPRAVRARRPARLLGGLLLGVALWLALGWLLVVPALEPAMRAIRAATYAGVADPGAIHGALARSALLGAALLLLVPGLLLGPTFALCVRLAEGAGLARGRAVGRVYLANSLGSLLAPLVVGFLLVPGLHVPGAWWLLAFVAGGAGVGLFGAGPGRAGARRLALATAAGAGLGMAGLAGGLLPADPTALLQHTVVTRGAGPRTLLEARTDAVTTASVVERADGERILYTDDFAAAATGEAYRYMRLLGHLPVLLAREPRSALVIAFGTGTTAGAVAQHAGVEHLTVVEVSPAVLGLAPWFAEVNRGVLDDPRVEVLCDDGRAVLERATRTWDVITLEPLMPYHPAGLPFYTREFYEVARSRLAEGGVLCQWLPVHALQPALYAALARTFFEVFPDGSLWYFEQSSALIGRRGSGAPTRAEVVARAQAAREDLAAAGLATPDALAGAFVAGGRRVLAAPGPAGGAASWRDRPVRDLDPWPEFEPTPRASLLLPYLHQTLEWLALLAQDDEPPKDAPFWPPTADRRWRAATRAGLLARMHEARGDFALRAGPDTLELALGAWAEALEGYARARAVLSDDRALELRALSTQRKRGGLQARRLLEAARRAARAGQAAEAAQALRLAERHTRALLPPYVADPDPAVSGALDLIRVRLGVLLALGRCAAARDLLGLAEVLFVGRPGAAEVAALVRGFEALLAGRAPGGWEFEAAAPCRQEGIAPVFEAAQALERALGPPPVGERVRLAARRLLAEALDEGVEAAAARFVVGLEVAGASEAEAAEARAVLAVLAERLDPDLGALEARFVEPGEGGAAALVEAARARLLGPRPAAVERAAQGEAAWRRGLARAIGEEGGPTLLARLAALLADADPGVRVEAAAALYAHAPDLAAGYDPLGPEAARAEVVQRVRERYAP